MVARGGPWQLLNLSHMLHTYRKFGSQDAVLLHHHESHNWAKAHQKKIKKIPVKCKWKAQVHPRSLVCNSTVPITFPQKRRAPSFASGTRGATGFRACSQILLPHVRPVCSPVRDWFELLSLFTTQLIDRPADEAETTCDTVAGIWWCLPQSFIRRVGQTGRGENEISQTAPSASGSDEGP